MKTCRSCDISQSEESFRKDISKKDGLASYCNSCNSIKQREWYKKNGERAKVTANTSYHKRKSTISTRRKELRQLNPEIHRQKQKDRYNPLKAKEYAWKAAGIQDMSIERYNDLKLVQNDSCAICGTHQDNLKRSLNVDHDHSSGKPRGLLCDACNRAIGYLKESEEIIINALNYLKCHK